MAAFELTKLLRLVTALLVSISAGVHLRLYRGGYRDIHLDDVFGIDLSRSFALAVVVGASLAVLLVASVTWDGPHRALSVLTGLYVLGTLIAYTLSRTTGLLGFEETRWVGEATIAIPAEAIALAALVYLSRRSTPSAA